MNETCAKTCNQCPFRKRSMPGYLGKDNPEHFLGATLAESLMPCHMTVDYTDPDWRKQLQPGGTVKLCRGALEFFANQYKVPRSRELPRVPRNTEVFSTIREFLVHHRAPNPELSEFELRYRFYKAHEDELKE